MRAVAAFAVGLATLTAVAQSSNLSQPSHIQTALNHFTVIDPGEPIVMFALADHTSFDIQQRENKLFLQPLSPNVATNLFIWTASRELTYEIDPAGDISKMSMLLVNAPSPVSSSPHGGASGPLKDDEKQQIALHAWDEAMLGTEAVTDEERTRQNSIAIKVEAVFRSKDQIIIRYSIHNYTSSPFRVTAPDVFESRPTQTPISLIGLRDHQLSVETFTQFKAVRGPKLSLLQSQISVSELSAGHTAVGILTLKLSQSPSPQLYQLSFGTADGRDITTSVVI